MTRDDIIRMAKEAGWKRVGRNPETGPEFPVLIGNLERFAALVAAPLEEEIKRLRFCIPEGGAAAAMEYLAYCVEKAVAAEREEILKLTDSLGWIDSDVIRARGQ